MDIRPKKSTVLIALTIATAGIVLVSVLRIRASASAAGQIAAGSAVPVVIVPQPTSPLQIVSVTATAVAPQISPRTPANVVAGLKAYNVALKNVTGQDVIAYTLQLTTAEGAQTGAMGGAFTAHYGTAGKPALAAGQTKSDVVTLSWYRDDLAIRVDLVLLDDGTVYGANISRDFDKFIERIDTRQGVEQWILSTLQSQGPEETQRLLKENLAYVNDQLAKFTLPNWVK